MNVRVHTCGTCSASISVVSADEYQHLREEALADLPPGSNIPRMETKMIRKDETEEVLPLIAHDEAGFECPECGSQNLFVNFN